MCGTYAPTAIAMMRNPAKPGCFVLDKVVVVARTSSKSVPRLFVQDVGGGPYSAIMAKCSPTAVHPCPASALATTEQIPNGQSVTLRGYYSHGKVSGFEEFYIESIVDNATMLPVPPPASLQVADIARGATATPTRFQKVNVTVAKADPLVMYDFSPSEFAGRAPCPVWLGFGMIPASAGAPVAASCSGLVNPAGVAAPSPSEVLIARSFYQGFDDTTDCGCAATSKQVLLTPRSSVSGPISGILSFDERLGTTMTHQVFLPMTKAEFPIL